MCAHAYLSMHMSWEEIQHNIMQDQQGNKKFKMNDEQTPSHDQICYNYILKCIATG